MDDAGKGFEYTPSRAASFNSSEVDPRNFGPFCISMQPGLKQALSDLVDTAFNKHDGVKINGGAAMVDMLKLKGANQIKLRTTMNAILSSHPFKLILDTGFGSKTSLTILRLAGIDWADVTIVNGVLTYQGPHGDALGPVMIFLFYMFKINESNGDAGTKMFKIPEGVDRDLLESIKIVNMAKEIRTAVDTKSKSSAKFLNEMEQSEDVVEITRSLTHYYKGLNLMKPWAAAGDSQFATLKGGNINDYDCIAMKAMRPHSGLNGGTGNGRRLIYMAVTPTEFKDKFMDDYQLNSWTVCDMVHGEESKESKQNRKKNKNYNPCLHYPKQKKK